jgi:hypothetical protein
MSFANSVQVHVKWRKNYIWKFFITAYCSFLLFLRLTHEPWRDEVQTWLLISESGTKELIQEFTINGSLFFLLVLKGFERIGINYFLLNLMISLILVKVVFQFLSNSKINLYLKYLLVLNPIIVFDYFVINRVYSLLIILLLLSIIEVNRENPRPKVVFLITCGFGILGFFGLIFAVFHITLWSVFNKQLIKRLSLSKIIIVFVLFLHAIPFGWNYNREYSTSSHNKIVFDQIYLRLRTVINNFAQLLYGKSSESEGHAWEKQIYSHVHLYVALATIILFILFFNIAILSTRIALITSSFLFFMFLFFTFVYPAGPRHLIICILLPLWGYAFSEKLVDNKRKRNIPELRSLRNTLFLLVTISFVAFQSKYAFNLIKSDLDTPFSSVSQLVVPNNANEVVMFYPDYLGITYLARAKVLDIRTIQGYYPEGNYFGVYRDFGNSRKIDQGFRLEKFCSHRGVKKLVTFPEISNQLRTMGIGSVEMVSGHAIVRDESNIVKLNIAALCTDTKLSSKFVRFLIELNE